MAITLADFTKIWASTSPLTPYSFSESNYKEGWNFIGGTPPARQMWDSIQKQNDEKLKYIVDNFLPLDGSSKMTGAVSFEEQGEIGFRGTMYTDPSEVCKQLVATAGTVNSAWNDGNAKLCLHTYDSTETNTAEDGGFALQTSDGTNAPYLEGKPNGDLKWSGKSIERVNSSASEGGAGYIRYENGLQICWGGGTASGTSSGKTISYQVAFNYAPSVTVTAGSLTATASNHVSIQASGVTTTSFDCVLSVGSAWSTGSFRWIAIGTWK